MNDDQANPLVLLIDDSPDVHRLLKVRLRNEPLRLVSARTAREGLQILKTQALSAVLLDLQMPDMDGFQTIRAIKEDTETNTIPIIVVSGLHGADDKVAALDLGATDYVTKPFDMAELRARLRAALRLHKLLSLLADRADVDGLTGLGNRAAFDKRLAEKIAESRRYGHALSLAMLDVDHFKAVNDTYGHPAGDEVLVGIASLLPRHMRETDVACRYGGEEFALIMPSTAPQDAAVVAERIRAAVEAMVWPRHPEHRVTCSIGLTGFAGSADSLPPAETWVEAADRNLYAAKNAGRNKVVMSDLGAPGILQRKAG